MPIADRGAVKSTPALSFSQTLSFGIYVVSAQGSTKFGL
jgi:hypothetical protein